MPYVPNEADAATYPRQAVPMALDLDNFLAALMGYGVIEGCAVSAGSGLTYSVAAGTWSNLGRFAAISAVTNQAMTAAHATLPRIDAITISNAGTITYRAGTAAAAPTAPTYTAGDTVLALIYVPPTATSLTSTNIRDKRLFLRPVGTVYQAGAQTAITTAVTNQAAWAGLTIPANFLKAGQRIRLKAELGLTTGVTAVNVTVRALYGATVLATSGLFAGGASKTEAPIIVDLDILVISTTAFEVQGRLYYGNNTTSGVHVPMGASSGVGNSAPITVSTTTAQALTLDVTTSAAPTSLTPRLLAIDID